ncbi:hypothetical protein CWB73_14175 [Pseudoalteromonas phenolica]|uniref:Uncharacterized protein n=1 Tax=Pseudoalteromonas phenolica TaxID=161398 RepID=A0A4Q7IJW4_9GAMM|nr:hypothetical protein [Pseudoalteromonas phenolica]RZQ51699.1 hypothetical protein C1E23_17850 [Pseudoalteromonas phenolica]TMN87353.1 hypothetical protein CWB72_15610 [Pseudoalteromonas phenolica]TMP79259.1 hypothetical protein CWB73_14175 [Pseudoalteromonas phenolica]
MKLKLNSKKLKTLSNDKSLLPSDATHKIAGGKPPASDSWCGTEFCNGGRNTFCFTDGCWN